jgi:glycosyltransferase involved in cell wall biosynthesis
MKVILLTNFMPPYRVPVFAELRRQLPGLEVWLSATSETGRLWEQSSADFPVRLQRGLTIRRSGRARRGFAPRTDLHIPADTLPQLLRRRPECVVTTEFGARTIAAALYKKTHPRTRLVLWATLSEHTESHRARWKMAIRRALLRTMDAVIVNGASGRRYIESLKPDVPVHIVRQASLATSPVGSARQPTPSELTLIYVGNLAPWKGVVPWLEELASKPSPYAHTVRVILVGEGPERASSESLTLPTWLSIELKGHLPPEKVLASYAEADAMVFPTHSDEWGLVVNEALGSGVPVLGSVHSQAVTELVQPAVNGYIFDPLVEGDFARALEQLLTLDDAERATMRDACLRTVADLTPADMARQLARVIADLDAPPREGRRE